MATTNALNNNNHQHLLHALKPGSNNNLNVQSINLAGVQGAVANLPTLQSIQVHQYLKFISPFISPQRERIHFHFLNLLFIE